MNKFGLLLVIVLVSGCATVRVDIDYDAEASFRHLHKYAWLDEKSPKSGNQLIDSNTLLHDRIRSGIQDWFQVNGYLLVPRKEADFLIVYRIVVENQTQVAVLNPLYDYPFYWRYGYGRGYYSSFAWQYRPQRRVYQYQRGTLIVDIVDPETKKLIWRGMAHQDFNAASTPAKKQQTVDRTIKAILARFPPEETRGERAD